MTVVCAGGQVDGVDLESMDVNLIAALWRCTASSLRRISSAVTGCWATSGLTSSDHLTALGHAYTTCWHGQSSFAASIPL